jgi:hypothetical protein
VKVKGRKIRRAADRAAAGLFLNTTVAFKKVSPYINTVDN